MEKYRKNIELLKHAVKTDAVIRHVSEHRKADGSLDIEGNLTLWNRVLEPFEKTKLWENGTPGYDDRDPLQPEPYFVYIPASEEFVSRGTILIAHGGGFTWRTGAEGINVAWYFHKAGFHTAILCYRLVPYTRFDAIADMQRAIRILRSKKEEWNLGEKLAVMGFSAGGMLSGNCATHFDAGDPKNPDQIEQFSSRPDAAVIGYGAMTAVSFPKPFGLQQDDPMMGTGIKEKMYFSIEKHVDCDTPPMFIWQTMSDDGRTGMCLAKALQDAEVPYELHIFTPGVHGLGMADGKNDLGMDIPHVAHWGELCSEWLKNFGF